MVRTQALTVLLALLATDSGAVMVDALHASGLAMRVLQDVVQTPHRSLLQVCCLPWDFVMCGTPAHIPAYLHPPGNLCVSATSVFAIWRGACLVLCLMHIWSSCCCVLP